MTARGQVGWRQAKVLKFVTDYQLSHQCSPSIREIGDGVGLSSTSSVAWHLTQLQNKGLVAREAGTRGTVVATELITLHRRDLEALTSLAGELKERSEKLTALVEQALFLRAYGERPPGAPENNPEAETWGEWTGRAEAYLRSLLPEALREEL